MGWNHQLVNILLCTYCVSYIIYTHCKYIPLYMSTTWKDIKSTNRYIVHLARLRWNPSTPKVSKPIIDGDENPKAWLKMRPYPSKCWSFKRWLFFFWDLRRKHLTWLMLRVWLSMTSKCGFRLFTILFWLVWTFDNPASNGAPPIAQSYESRYVFFSSQRLTRKEKASGMANGLSREGWQRKKMFKPLRILWLSDKISW